MTDLYVTAGDVDLASKSSATKEIHSCTEHNSPKELFHFITRRTLCSQCLVDMQIDRDHCVEARVFCQAMMQRFVRLLDNATYMPIEHIQKEKEYGIPWRSAFKAELLEFVQNA